MVTKEKTPYLIFAIDDRKLAIELSLVEQVYSAVEVTPLEGAPDTVLGLINVHGTMVVVLNVRRKLGLRQRSIELSDQIVIVNIEERQLALLVDEVVEVLHASPDEITAPKPYNAKIAEEKHGFSTETDKIELYELLHFLSSEDEEKLTTALQLAYSH
ncbi:MAG TPA: chemotaxis protein CheW [Drouetiella sp.]|jgi:purine-binding chemotaxis protein CheW